MEGKKKEGRERFTEGEILTTFEDLERNSPRVRFPCTLLRSWSVKKVNHLPVDRLFSCPLFVGTNNAFALIEFISRRGKEKEDEEAIDVLVHVRASIFRTITRARLCSECFR